MSLTPQRNPIPKLSQNQGTTGTFPTPASVTTNDGVVTHVQAGTPAASTPTSGTTNLQANAPLVLSGSTLTVSPATSTSTGVVAPDGVTILVDSSGRIVASAAIVTTLPVPTSDTQGKFYLLNGMGATDDQLWVGINRATGQALGRVCFCDYLPNPSSSSSSSSSSSH